jgi:cellulose synthase/poly-beta-1,6-N-acetylglucosamine synthase-like glycosyltransferase
LAGGDDGTYEISKQIVDGDNRFRVIERGPEPKNVALTRGFEVARYDVLVILDADSIVETGWLTALVTPLLEGAAASFGMHQPITKTWISMAEYMDVFLAYHILGTELAQGCSSLAIWRTKMNEIGPLPTNAFSWEDWDIAVRLVNAGESVCFAPKARLLTSRPSSLKEYWNIIVRSNVASPRCVFQTISLGYSRVVFYCVQHCLSLSHDGRDSDDYNQSNECSDHFHACNHTCGLDRRTKSSDRG